MSKKITYRLILKDSENRAVTLDIEKVGRGGKKLTTVEMLEFSVGELSRRYEDQLKSEEEKKNTSVKNDEQVKKNAVNLQEKKKKAKKKLKNAKK